MMNSPWKQQQGEPDAWFSRFERFRRLGPTRSLEATWRSELEENKAKQSKTKQAKRPHPDWYTAAKTWDWKRRAAAWDTTQSVKADNIWEKRRQQLRDREWEISESLYRKASDLLGAEPEKWSLRDLVSLYETSDKLGSKAASADEDGTKQQLAMARELMRQLLTLDSVPDSVKDMVRLHLDAVLLTLGKPVAEVIEMMQTPEE